LYTSKTINFVILIKLKLVHSVIAGQHYYIMLIRVHIFNSSYLIYHIIPCHCELMNYFVVMHNVESKIHIVIIINDIDVTKHDRFIILFMYHYFVSFHFVTNLRLFALIKSDFLLLLHPSFIPIDQI